MDLICVEMLQVTCSRVGLLKKSERKMFATLMKRYSKEMTYEDIEDSSG